MRIVLISLIFLGYAPHAFASATSLTPSTPSEISYLLSKLDAARGPASIQSYESHASFYTYDQALAVIAFSHAGHKKAARQVLLKLKSAQTQSGGWNFQLNSNTNLIAHETNEISGTIAWVALAANTYQIKFNDPEFQKLSLHGLRHLNKMRAEDLKSSKRRPVLFSPQKNIVSIEHQLDTLAAIQSLPTPLQTEFSDLKKSIILTLKDHWLGYRFFAGEESGTQIKNKNEIYLDTQSWGYLVLHNTDIIPNLEEGIKFNCGKFARQYKKNNHMIAGFYESNQASQLKLDQFIWLEGTYGMVAALKILEQKKGQAYNCSGLSARDFMDSLKPLQNKNGGLPYATVEIKDQFSAQASIAATAWSYFTEKNYNPFKPSIAALSNTN